MLHVLSSWYLVIKSLHIISVISWMAALFYLPRLFVYHVESLDNKLILKTFERMEDRLVRIIMTPAMLATFFSGAALLCVPGMLTSPVGWLHLKLLFVLILSAYHGYLVKTKRVLAMGENQKSSKYYRALNEVGPFFMILIVFLVVMKPF